MNPTEYIKGAMRTCSPTTPELIARLVDNNNIQLLHGLIGVVTEAGELFDAFKKHVFYGKPLDIVNVKEEIGDLMWYLAIILDYLGISLEEIMVQNNAKLRARYPEKFTEDKALNRDLDAERLVLENNG